MFQKVIKNEDLKNYILSSNHTFSSGEFTTIQPKFGLLTLDFSSEPDAVSCLLRFRRVSGNGLVILTADSITKEIQIISQTSQEAAFELGPSKILKIQRANRSSGDLCLSQVSLVYRTQQAVEPNLIGELKKAKSYSLIRVVDGKLFASGGGGSIESSSISNIQTDPPGVFKKTDTGVVFNDSCVITSLSIDVNESVQKHVVDVVVKAQPEPIEPTVLTKETEYVPTDPIVVNKTFVYDTSSSHFNPAFCVKSSEVNGNSAVIDFDGSYTIPLKMLGEKTGYSVTVEVERVNGNGKFAFGILPDTETINVKVAAGASRTFGCTVFIEDAGRDYSFSIWRTASSVGKIRVNRIVIKPDGAIRSARFAARENHVTHQPIGYIPNAPYASKLEQKAPEFTGRDILSSARPLSIPIARCNGDMVMRSAMQYSAEQGYLWNLLNNVSLPWDRSTSKRFVPVTHDGFIVIINRDYQLTNNVLKKLTNSSNVVVVGARGVYPNCIISINDYTEYECVMDVLERSSAVVDTADSGIVPLLHVLGKRFVDINGTLEDF
jgi:hypothetical protein